MGVTKTWQYSDQTFRAIVRFVRCRCLTEGIAQSQLTNRSICVSDSDCAKMGVHTDHTDMI